RFDPRASAGRRLERQPLARSLRRRHRARFSLAKNRLRHLHRRRAAMADPGPKDRAGDAGAGDTGTREAVIQRPRGGRQNLHDGKQTVSIHDLPPPKDSCRIALTVFHLPPVQGGWGGLPLEKMFRQSCDESIHKKKRKKSARPTRPLEIHVEPRPDLELVWADKGNWPDPENGKPIRCRQLMARARLVQVLITFD